MEEESAKEEEFDQKGNKLGKILTFVAIAIIPLAIFGLDLYNTFYNRQNDKKEEDIAKQKSRPHFEAEWGGEVPIGMEDYWRISLLNKNENNITSGTFDVQYRVFFRTEMGVSGTLVWEDVFWESEIAFDDDLQGCFLFIKADFFTHEELIMETCVNNDVEVAECDSYAFCCFQYIEDGQEKTVYYLISLKRYEKCKVTEVENPEEYMKLYLMDS